MSSSPSSTPRSPQRPSLLRMLSRSTSVAKQGEKEEMDVLLRDLPTPSFVINRHSFRENCEKVLELAAERQLKLRPHVKTHKTLEGIQLQANAHKQSHPHDPSPPVVTGFVASTLPEVKLLVNYYTRKGNVARSGSILYGVPISETKLPALVALQERLNNWHYQQSLTTSSTGTNSTSSKPTQIVILMDHPQQIEMVRSFLKLQQITNQKNDLLFPVMIKLDTGYHRAGTTSDLNGVQLVEQVIQAPFLDFIGVYSHCGHAYDEDDQTKLDQIAQKDLQEIQCFLALIEQHFKDNAAQLFGNEFTISIGSTPSLTHHFHPYNDKPQKQEWWTQFFQRYPNTKLEMHPGNYTLCDRQQLYTKACPNVQAIAGRVLTRVIGHYNDKNRPYTILMDAGATALTKESTPQGGMAAITGHEDDANVYKMSQEVSMARGTSEQFLKDCSLGALLTLIPNHSCLAAACFEKYYVIDDPTGQFAPDTPIVDEWEPVKGW